MLYLSYEKNENKQKQLAHFLNEQPENPINEALLLKAIPSNQTFGREAKQQQRQSLIKLNQCDQ